MTDECMKIYEDVIKYNMVDTIFLTGVSIVADIGKKEKEEIS